MTLDEAVSISVRSREPTELAVTDTGGEKQAEEEEESGGSSDVAVSVTTYTADVTTEPVCIAIEQAVEESGGSNDVPVSVTTYTADGTTEPVCIGIEPAVECTTSTEKSEEQVTVLFCLFLVTL